MAGSILFSGWLASLTLIVSVSLAVYWVVGHRSSKRKRNSPLPKLSKPGQQDRKAEESRNRKVKAEAEAAEDFGQVVANVQTALQGQGYYAGEVDGSLGPLTRDAIAKYQQDHGLIVTSAVDEPTLASLGMA
jgi:His-Xaa-Ser repeat protein HxsA